MGGLSGAPMIAVIALGLGVVAVRRRSVAIVLVALQSLVLGIAAVGLAEGRSVDYLVASGVLIVKAVALPALLVLARRRTREPRLVAAAAPMLARVGFAAAAGAAAAAAMPALELEHPDAGRGAAALVAIGCAIVVTRRPTLFQALGLLVAENGVYALAIAVPGGMPFLIELGVLFDLVLIVAISAAFSQKIYEELGTGDTEFLRGLRD